MTVFAAEQLRTIIERIELLCEEKQDIADGIKAVCAEAKANGFDTKAIRKVIKIRKIEIAEWQQQEAVLDRYMSALGMLPDQQDEEGA